MLLLYVKATLTVYPICDWPCMCRRTHWSRSTSGMRTWARCCQPGSPANCCSRLALKTHAPRRLTHTYRQLIHAYRRWIHTYGPTLIDYKVVLTNLASRRQTQAYRQLAYAYKRLTPAYIWQAKAYRPRLSHAHRLQIGAHNPHP